MKTMAIALTRPRAVTMPRPLSIRRVHFWAGVRLASLARAEAPGGFFSTGPQWGLAIDVLDGLLAARRLALHPVTQQVGQDDVVPAAGLAHLHHHDLELPELAGHLLQLGGHLYPARELAELVAEDVGQVD